jgi:hypothetical protein
MLLLFIAFCVETTALTVQTGVCSSTLVIGVPGLNKPYLEVFMWNAENDSWIWDQNLTQVCGELSTGVVRLCGDNLFVIGRYGSNCDKKHSWFHREGNPRKFVNKSTNAFDGEMVYTMSCEVMPSGVTRIALSMFGGYSTNESLNHGRVTLWQESGGTITQFETIAGSDIAGVTPQAQFGLPVLLTGDSIFVGARFTKVDELDQAGAVHQFAWQSQPYLSHSHRPLYPTQMSNVPKGEYGAVYGMSLAAGGSSLLVTGILINPGPIMRKERTKLLSFVPSSGTGPLVFSQDLTREEGRGSPNVITGGRHAIVVVSGQRFNTTTNENINAPFRVRLHLLRRVNDTHWEPIDGFFESDEYDGILDYFGGLNSIGQTEGVGIAPLTGDIVIGKAKASVKGPGIVYVMRCAEVRIPPPMSSTTSQPSTSQPASESTSTPAPTSSNVSASLFVQTPTDNVPAIVGGVIGGVAGLAIIICLVIWLARRRKQTTGRSLKGAIPESELSEFVEIGEGAFGKVFKAKYNHESVAVKTVNHNALGRDEDILNEVAVLHKVATHSHIVAYRGFAIVKGRPALVLELCEGGSLLSALTSARDSDWPEERQLKVANGIAAGVAYLHRNGIIHRDLAARNVLLTGNDVARLTDFGLSVKSSARDEMKTSSPAGAVSWMAPEQLIKDDKGQYTFSTKSDVYSFGVVLFELFERKAPWSECESRAEIVNKLQSGETLTTDDSKYPGGVLAIVKLCWSEAAQRETMSAVAKLLDKLHDGAVKNSKRSVASSQAYIDDNEGHPGAFKDDKSDKKKTTMKKQKKSVKPQNDYFDQHGPVDESSST